MKLIRSKKTQVVLSLLISLQIAVEPALAKVSSSQTNQSIALQRQTHSPNALYKDVDPIWKQFTEAKADGLKLQFSHNDPSLDQDPFFMRSQNWSNQNINTNNNIEYRQNETSLDIIQKGSKKVLTLKLPLIPIQATEQFVFFSLNEKSNLFQKASGQNEKTGEGIFFINREELSEYAKNNRAVPVYFFPLAGQGWTGKLSSLQIPQSNMLVVANNEESVALELQDVETLMKAEQINLVLASALTLKNRSGKYLSTPAAGMTASFGLVFTGVDLQMPEKSFWPQKLSAFKSPDESQNKFVQNFIEKISSKFNNLAALTQNQSYAMDLSPELIERLVYVGTILTGMLAASVVIKYAHPGVRSKIKSFRSGSMANTKNPIKIAGREIKEVFDVFASMSTTASQIASVSFANSLEMFLDRFMPTIAAADHTLVRRFLKNSFYYSRDLMRKVPVNSKTFYLGAIVLGGVDTAMVAIQYQAAVPWIAQNAATQLSPESQQRFNDAFDVNNPKYQQIALQDTIRNGLSHIQSGASSYSSEARAQVIDIVTKEIESEMKSKGQDPDDPKFQSLKEKMIEEKINITMKQKGLPDNKYFLFDMSTVYQTIPKTLGYNSPEELQAAESFILEKRSGLSKNALNKAIKTAQEWVRSDNSQEAREALALLQETAKSMSFLVNGIKSGKKGFIEAQKARLTLTLLSYEGSLEYGLKYLPEAWAQKYSKEAANAAGLMFRQALYSYLSKEGDNLVFSSKENAKKHGEKAKEIAFEALKKQYPQIKDMSSLTEGQTFELKFRTQIEINNLAHEEFVKANAEKFSPKKSDWMTRRKQDKALAEAEAKIAEFLKTSEGKKLLDNNNLDRINQIKQTYFRNSLAKKIGLHIEDKAIAEAQGRTDYIKMLDLVEQQAQESTDNEIKLDPNMARYFEKISTTEQNKLKMFIYANNFFQQYKDATTLMEMVSPIDPAQPGKFQKLRQTEIVRNSKFLTRTLRIFESFVDDQNMNTSLRGSIERNVPFAGDLLSAHRRMAKVFLPMMTVSYAWSFYAWQVHMPFSAWLIMGVTAAATISAPSQWLNRAMRLNGLKAQDNTSSKIAYSLPYAWVTFAGLFPIMLYSGDVAAMFADYVRTPVLSLIHKIGAKEIALMSAAAVLALAKIRKLNKVDVTGKSNAIGETITPRQSQSTKEQDLRQKYQYRTHLCADLF